MVVYLILIILALLIAAALLVLRKTRRRLEEMDGLGKVIENGEDEDEDLIGSFGK